MIDDQRLLAMLFESDADADRAMSQLLNDPVVRGKLWKLVVDGAGGSADDASEILQEAAVRFYRKMLDTGGATDAVFAGRSAVRTFFIGFVKNVAREWLRGRGRVRLVEERHFFDEIELPETEKDDQKAHVERRDRAFGEVFADLTEKCRRALTSYIVEEKSYEIVRQELNEPDPVTGKTANYSIEKARTKVWECRQRLRQIIEGRPDLLQILKNVR